MNTTPENMAAETLADFPIRFEWALDDLRALVSGRPIIAEGWGLRPNLVAPIIDSPRQMVVMVPTEEFRQHQRHQTARASALSHRVNNPERAQHNRLARDRLVAEDALRSARRFGIRTIEVNSSHDAGAIADILADHFRPYLPPSDRHRA